MTQVPSVYKRAEAESEPGEARCQDRADTSGKVQTLSERRREQEYDFDQLELTGNPLKRV